MISIQKQTLLLALVLAVIVISSTLSGYLIFSRYYQTAESRFESNAEIALSNGSHAIRGLLRFYQGILDTLATNHQVKDLLAFGEIEEIVAWTQATANKLPGALGTALANIDGKVIGGLKIQRVGDKCQKDLHDFAIGQQFSYPPVHRQIPELEHFDLAAPLKGLDDETKGILFISFRLTLLQGLLDDLVNGDRQRFSLYSGNDLISISSNRFKDGIELRTFEMDIPDSTWRLKLEIPEPDGLLFHYAMFMVAACSIMLTALTVYLVLRRVTQSISFDIVSIHQAMTSVLEGNYQPGNTQTQLRETAHLIADIDHVATQLQTRQRQLEKDNTTDPLTGLINRRHFDLMLEHDFVQSERGSHSYLLLIDLNDFKQVNDNHGHIVGDEVLKSVALSLLKGIRATDLAARIGGDEFALILRNLSADTVASWAKKFCLYFDDTVGHYLNCKDINHRSTLSVGIAPISRLHFDTLQEIVMAADAAMYQAKENKALGSHYVLSHPQESY